MDEDTRQEIFDSVTSDECYEAGCPDYHEYQEQGRHWGQCTGNMMDCPVVAEKIDLMRDYPEPDDDYPDPMEDR